MNKNNFFFALKYPALLHLIAVILIFYFFFISQIVIAFAQGLGFWSYVYSFFAGLLFAMGLFAPIGAGYLIISNPPNIFIAAVIAGFGAMITDILIFKFVKAALKEKSVKLEENWVRRLFDKAIKNNIGGVLIPFIAFPLAGFLIGIPFPYKAGAIFASGVLRLETKHVAIISLVLNSLVLLFFISLNAIIAFVINYFGIVA